LNGWKAVSLCLVMAWGLFVPGLALGAQGDLLWEKQLTFLPQYDTITINYTALTNTSYMISGSARNSDYSAGQVGFIKAYDVATGDIKWEKTLTLGATGNGFGSIAVNGDIALVRGSYSSSSGSPPVYTLVKSFIRAYQVDTGVLLWEVLRDFEGSPTQSGTLTFTTLTANNRVFTFFAAINASGTTNYGTFFVRAYQVRNITMAPMLLLEEDDWTQ
jgi:hypothetical protein